MFDPVSSFDKNNKIKKATNDKKNKFKIINILKNLHIFIIVFILFSFLTLLPVLINFLETSWYIKILMVMGSLYAFHFLLIIPAIFYETTKSDKILFYFSPFFLFFLIGIVGYFNFDLWGKKNLLIGLSFGWMLFVGLYGSVKVLFNKQLSSETIPNVLVSIAILSLIIAILNEKINGDTSNIYYKISIGIIYIILLAVYINKYIYKEQTQNKVISNILGIIFWGAIIAISFPFYVKWCGITGEDFSAFVSVYSALLGGGITLAGVAWTIRHNYVDKKFEESKKNIPYITILPYKFFKKNFDICLTFGKNIKNNHNDMDKDYESIMSFCIKNISNTIITIESIKIDEIFYEFDKKICFEKNMIVMIKCCCKELFVSKNGKMESIELFMKNANDEKYSSKCILRLYSNKETATKPKSNSYQVMEILFPKKVNNNL